MKTNPAKPPRLGTRRSLVEDVVSTISEWINTRELDPDQPLPSEAELAEQFAVSRTVIRESVRLLAERGLIEVVHGKRHRILPPSGKFVAGHLQRMLERTGGAFEDLVELRLPLEREIAALAAQRRSESQLAALHEAMIGHDAARSLDAQVQQDLLFHRRLAEATGNVMFALVLDAIAEPMAAARRKSIGRAGFGVATEHHRLIYNAVEAGDAAEAVAMMEQHLAMAFRDLTDEA